MGPFANEREVQDSLAPVQLDVTVDQEVASMKRGKGVQLLAIAVVAIGCVSGGVLAVQRLDRDRAYEQASAAAQDLRRTHVTAFVQCALPFAKSSSMESSERLYAAFADMIERSSTHYADVLRQCEPKLASLAPELAALSAPKELRGSLDGLRQAASQLNGSAAALRGALEDPAQSEDYVAVTAHADKLAKAIFGYEARDDAMQGALAALR